MEHPSEEKVVDFWEELLERIPEEYFAKHDALGVAEVEQGLVKVNVPTTVYNITNDDASGVAGVLLPSGEFIRAAGSKVGGQARFWEFDETLGYERVNDENNRERVVGNSWTEGTVIWDGVVNGSLNLAGLAGEAEDLKREVVKRRTKEASLTGEWKSTGELWRAIRRGTGQAGVTQGIAHYANSGHEENLFDSLGESRKEAA